MTDPVGRAKQVLWDRYREVNPDIHVDRKVTSISKKNLLKPEWIHLIKEDYDKGVERNSNGNSVLSTHPLP
jgi:hypothetical protein